MKKIIGIILAVAIMLFAEVRNDMRNGTGFFVNSGYIVTAYHVVENFGNICYYDIGKDTCYRAHLVDYTVGSDLALLKLDDEPVDMPAVCRIEHSELPIGEPMMSYGYPDPLAGGKLSVISLDIRMHYRCDGDTRYYRTNGTIRLGTSGGPTFTRKGKIGGMNKAIALNEMNTSNIVKSTEIVRILKRNGVSEYPNTKNVKKCSVSIINSVDEFKSSRQLWSE